MLARVVGTIIERLTAPPLALKVHAALVLAAAGLLTAFEQRSAAWVRVAFVAIVLWPLLRGSRLIWWVQVVALAGALWRVYDTHTDMSAHPKVLSAFLDERVLLSTGVVLAGAWLLLFVSSVRRYVRTGPAPPTGLAVVLGVSFIGAFPAWALEVDSLVPNERLRVETAGTLFAGADPAGPVAFYVTREQDGMLCLVTIESNGSGSSCRPKSNLRSFGLSRSEDVIGELIPKEVVRVELSVRDGTMREATVLEPDGFPANVYYLIDPPRFGRTIEVVGYDASGREVFAGP